MIERRRQPTATASMPDPDKKPRHHFVLLFCVGLLGLATIGVIFSPVLYQMLLKAGDTGRDPAIDMPATATGTGTGAAGETINVSFDVNVGAPLNWTIRPQTSLVTVAVGKPTLVYFDAKNLGDATAVARGVFDVSPFQAAPYLYEVAHFCFVDVKLEPGEAAHVPMLFYFDKAILADRQATATRHITLSYSFYKQEGDPEQLAAAEDLRAASEAEEAAIKSGGTQTFVNDALRD